MASQEMVVIDSGSIVPYTGNYGYNAGAGAGAEEYYPYLVPFASEPEPMPIPMPIPVPQPMPIPMPMMPPPPPRQDGPTYEEMENKIDRVKESNKGLVAGVVVLLILLLAAGAAIAVIILIVNKEETAEGGTVTVTNTTVIATIVGFQVVKPSISFGTDFNDKNSLAYINAQQEFCDMHLVEWFAGLANYTACGVDSFEAGSLMADMRITVLNEGKTSDEVVALLKAIVIAESNTDVRTSQVLDASFSIVDTVTETTTSTKTVAGAAALSAKFTMVILMVLLPFQLL